MRTEKIKETTNRIALWDGERKVTLTDGFIAALENLVREEIKMMAAIDGVECWSWGVVEVNDLASSSALVFTFGGDDDPPGKPEVEIIVK